MEETSTERGGNLAKEFDAGALSDAQLDALIDGADLEFKRPVWEKEVNVQLLGGYNDNVLQGAFQEDESFYIGAGLEVFIWRPREEGKADVYFYLLGEFTFYSDADEIDTEGLAVFQTRISKPLSAK